MKTSRTLLALLLTLLVWLGLPAGPAQAHANLISSNPSAGQALPRFPTRGEFQFSEPVNPATARFVLYDASGLAAATGTAALSPADPHVVEVSFPSQRDGVYRVDWQVQSAVDGHVTSGTVAFSVGINTPKASLLPPPGTRDPATSLPGAGEIIFRWLGYLSASLATGCVLFAALIWQPAYRRQAAPLTAWDERLSRWLWGLILLGVLGSIDSLIGVAVEITAAAGGTITDPGLLLTFGHSQAWIGIVQWLVLASMAALVASMARARQRRSLLWWLIAGLGGVLLATYSLSGHNAAMGEPLPILGDWLHLAGMAAWIGGLLPLGLLLAWSRKAQDGDFAALLVNVTQRFSRMALICVGIIGLTGLYSALVQIQTLSALTGTRYGQAVLLKSGLFALLIGLGAINQLGILPNLARSGFRALRRLGGTVRVEYVLGVLVLLVVGGLMSLPPAAEALQADYRQGFHEVYPANQVRLDFRVAPAQVGDNELGVDVSDNRPGAEQVQPVVLFRIQFEDGSGQQVQVEAKPAGQARWTARGSYFSRMGVWQVEVIWRKSGFDDVTHVFNVDLARIAAGRGEKVNPVPADATSITDGSNLYQANCAPCHGSSGKGDGPAGQSLVPPPADLTLHVVPGVHTDGQLFDWIGKGYPGSAMPAFVDTLTEKQRWDVVNFIRTLGK